MVKRMSDYDFFELLIVYSVTFLQLLFLCDTELVGIHINLKDQQHSKLKPDRSISFFFCDTH